jgi:hypothetical protein
MSFDAKTSFFTLEDERLLPVYGATTELEQAGELSGTAHLYRGVSF